MIKTNYDGYNFLEQMIMPVSKMDLDSLNRDEDEIEEVIIILVFLLKFMKKSMEWFTYLI